MSLASPDDGFLARFRGSFTGLLTWEQLDAFWDTVRRKAGAGWYIYAIGEAAPRHPRGEAEVRRFIDRVNALLREDHRESYCGIVYADSKTDPSFVKIFDPNYLGASCGSSRHPPLPGWVMSLVPPVALESRRPLPEKRRRWWRGLWDEGAQDPTAP